MGRGRVGRGSGVSERTAAAVVPLPRGRPASLDLSRILPSSRTLVTAFAIVGAAVGAYFVARDTAVFAIRTVEVDGAPPSVVLQVKRALRADLGTSLLRLDVGKARQLVAGVPTVASASLDRAFPHTLRVVIVPERPVAVVRQGAASWLISAQGRVMASLQHGARPRLPRIWVGKEVPLELGGTAPGVLHDQLAAVSPLRSAKFPARVTSVRAGSDELTLVLRSGLQVRLGDAKEVPLKLAVAAKVLHLIATDTRYVDVSVPERPVAGSVLKLPTSPSTPATASAQITQATQSAAGSAVAATTHDGAAVTLDSQVEVDGTTSTTP